MSESVVTRLNNEWKELATQIWDEPLTSVDLLDGSTFDHLVYLARTFDHSAFGLLIAAQGGSASAGRVLLQAALPRLITLAQRYHVVIDDLVAAAWVRVMRHPLARDRKIVINISLDSLKAVTRANARGRRELPFDDPPIDPDPGASVVPIRARDVLDVAARHNLMPAESISVMHSVYVDGLTGRAAAERHDTTPEMIRYRCSAGMKALKSNVALLLDAA